MQKTYPKWLPLVALLLTVALSFPAAAQDGDIPDAEIENDEGGVAIIKGELNYTDPTLPDFGDQPMIFLGNMDGLFTGEFEFTTEYLDVSEPQVLGTITSDIAVSPFTFELLLPEDPGGDTFDVDNDGEDDPGIAVYSVNFTFNGLGDQFIDAREFIYFRSYEMSLDYETLYDVIGGKILVYAPVDQQGFPSGAGADGELFTEDDPVVGLPAGWTVVDLEADPFTFDRSHEANVDVIESAGEEVPDFSDMSYTEAWDEMIDMLRSRYAFTEYKALDWDAISEEFRPLIEDAEEAEDPIAFQIAMQQFVESIPDGHFGISSPYLNAQPLPSEVSGGLGMAIRELTDGRVIVNFLTDEGPAAQAGIEMGAEIIELNGTPIADAISAEKGLNPPYSGGWLERLEQLRDVTRYNVGEDVEVTYRNPGGDEETATLTTIEENESRLFSRESVFGPLLNPTLPIEYEVLDSGYGYIRIYSFSDNYDLSLSLWKRAMETMNGLGVPGIILDMRFNGGGSPSISEPMIGYFIDEPLYTGTAAFFFEDVGEFRQDDLYDRLIQPAEEQNRYYGDIAVLISPACASNCEYFSHALSLLDNATIIGNYPTAGLGGGIDYYFMPEDIFIQYPVQRNLGPDDQIIIEGMGVAPDVEVPVTDESLLEGTGDQLLDAAIAHLNEASAPETVDMGEVAVGDSVDGEIAVNTRNHYTLEVAEDATLNLSVSDPDQALDTVLRVLDTQGTVLAENDDIELGVRINSAIEDLDVKEGDTLVLEVATYEDGSEGAYTLTVEAE